jgi:hypothetical protein
LDSQVKHRSYGLTIVKGTFQNIRSRRKTEHGHFVEKGIFFHAVQRAAASDGFDCDGRGVDVLDLSPSKRHFSIGFILCLEGE